MHKAWFPLLFLLSCWVSPHGSQAGTLWPEEEQLLTIGVRLFPACLAADLGLANRVDAMGKLQIIVLHADDPDAAGMVTRSLQQLGKVRNWPLELTEMTPREFAKQTGGPIAAIFLATPRMDPALFVEAEKRQAMLFSPFRGDVERGATSGINVTDRILPYVNLPSARRAGVRFKPFFLRAAKQHE